MSMPVVDCRIPSYLTVYTLILLLFICTSTPVVDCRIPSYVTVPDMRANIFDELCTHSYCYCSSYLTVPDTTANIFDGF